MVLGITVMCVGGVLLLASLVSLEKGDGYGALGFFTGGAFLAVVGASQVDASNKAIAADECCINKNDRQ